MKIKQYFKDLWIRIRLELFSSWKKDISDSKEQDSFLFGTLDGKKITGTIGEDKLGRLSHYLFIISDKNNRADLYYFDQNSGKERIHLARIRQSRKGKIFIQDLRGRNNGK